MKSWLLTLSSIVLLAAPACAFSKEPLPIPAALAPWSSWVETQSPTRACIEEACLWLSGLSVDKTSTGAQLSFVARNLSSKSEVLYLPGDSTRWPSEALLNGKPMTIGRLHQRPVLFLPAHFSGLISVLIDHGELSALPVDPHFGFAQIDGKNWVPLGSDGLNLEQQLARLDSSEPPALKSSNVEIKIQRLLSDGQRPTLQLHLLFSNPGKKQSIKLSHLLPQLAEPIAAQGNSALWDNGSLLVTLPPGQSSVDLVARLSPDLDQLKLTAPTSDKGVIDPVEFWSIQSGSLRLINATGKSVDPKAAGIFGAWQQYPTFETSLGEAPTLSLNAKVDNRDPFVLTSNSLSVLFNLDGKGLFARQVGQVDARAPGLLQANSVFEISHGQLNKVPTPIFMKDKKFISLPAGSSLFEVAATGPAPGLWVDLPKNILGGAEDKTNAVKASVEMPGGWKVLWISGAQDPRGLFAAFNLWEVFFLVGLAWGMSKLLGRPLGLALLTAVIFGRLYAGAPFFIYAPLIICAAISQFNPKKDDSIDSRLAQSARYATLFVGLILSVLILMPLTFERVQSTLHPSMDMLSQPASFSSAFDNPSTVPFPQPGKASVNAQMLQKGSHNFIDSGAHGLSESLNFILSLVAFGFLAKAVYDLFKYRQASKVLVDILISFVLFGSNSLFMLAPQVQLTEILGQQADTVFAERSSLTFGHSAPSGEIPDRSDHQTGAPNTRMNMMAQEADTVLSAAPAPAAAPSVKKTQQYNESSNSVAQAGTGEPNWHWNRLSFTFKQSVDEARLWMLSPWLSRLLGLFCIFVYWFSLFRIIQISGSLRSLTERISK